MNQFPQPSNIPAYVPNERQAEWVGNDGHRDAFRHAYWNSLLVRNFGKEWTNQFTTAHEAAWSDQVPLWQHGLTDGTPGRGGQPVPEGNASAQ